MNNISIDNLNLNDGKFKFILCYFQWVWKNIGTIWQKVQSEQDFYDIILACDEKFIQTHKLVISAMSPILRNILKQNLGHHLFIYLKGIK